MSKYKGRIYLSANRGLGVEPLSQYLNKIGNKFESNNNDQMIPMCILIK